MKKIVLVALVALVGLGAEAYQNQGGFPGTVDDAVFKPVVKSAVAGVSDAIASDNEVLSYSAANDGYTVTRVGSAGSFASNLIACVPKEAIATGDTAAHLCQVKGFARVKWDATGNAPFYRGQRLCANSVGAAVNCGAVASASGVISLEDHTGGSGDALPVLLDLQ